MKERILKEGLIAAALVVVTCFINGVMFYDFSPNNSEDILHRSYSESQDVKDVFAQINEIRSKENPRRTYSEVIEKVEVHPTDAEKKANVLIKLCKEYDRVVFVDDDKKNVSAARELNIKNLKVIKAWDE